MYKQKLKSGLIVTHNHPTNISFSRTDILAIKRASLNEIRAVTKDYLYSARFIKSINMDVGFLNELILDIDHWVRLDFNRLIRNGKLTMSLASTKHWHEVWTRLCSKTDWFSYERTKRG